MSFWMDYIFLSADDVQNMDMIILSFWKKYYIKKIQQADIFKLLPQNI